QHVCERACKAICSLAARGHEASRCPVGGQPDPALEEGPGRILRADGRAHGGRHAVAESVCAVLVETARSPRRLCGGRLMSVARADALAKPSLTLKRRFNAPAERVYAAWT